jgi:signal transduction histidine kinase
MPRLIQRPSPATVAMILAPLSLLLGSALLAPAGAAGAERGAASAIGWFTNYGHYMPRLHCLRAATGGPDWFWIITLIAGTAVVIVGYARIYLFWLKCYFAEQSEHRNKKLWQLANVFLMCAITGYMLSITMFFWPAYRLMAMMFAILVPATIAFMWNLRPFEVTFAAVRLLRERDVAQAELAERNRAMRLIFDNVAQGFVTIDLNGVMALERSAVVDSWFGVPSAHSTLSAYLAEQAPAFAQSLELGLEQLRDDWLPQETALGQLPTNFAVLERSFDVSYTPIAQDGRLARLLVIVNDVTELVARERAERMQRELVTLFERISVDRSGVEEFVSEGAALVASLRTEEDPLVQRRLLHTLKGNTALYGLDSCALLAHDLEAELERQSGGLTAEQRARLVNAWKEAMRWVGQLLGYVRRDRVEVERIELEGLATRARAGADGAELLPTISQWFLEPIECRLQRLAGHAVALARRLGKPEPRVTLVGNGVRLEAECWTAYWSGMVHVVRNAVDHGIESPELRRYASKPETGTLELRAERAHGELSISVRDDGAGVDWEAVRRKARMLGLPHETRHELTEALFSHGFSLREQVSEISGRGVGLAALRQVVSDLGGSITIESEKGAGATFHFRFAESALLAANLPARGSAPPSLLPVAS